LALSSDNDVYLGICLDKRFFSSKKVELKFFNYKEKSNGTHVGNG